MNKFYLTFCILVIFVLSACGAQSEPNKTVASSTPSSVTATQSPSTETPQPSPTAKPQVALLVDAPLFSGPGNLDYPVIADLPAGTNVVPTGRFEQFVQVEVMLDNKNETGFIFQNSLPAPVSIPGLEAKELSWIKIGNAQYFNGFGKEFTLNGDNITIDNSSNAGYYEHFGEPMSIKAGLSISLQIQGKNKKFATLSLNNLPKYCNDYESCWRGVNTIQIVSDNGELTLNTYHGIFLNTKQVKLSLPDSTPIIVTFLDPQGKKISITKLNGDVVITLDTTKPENGGFANGLFPGKQASIGFVVPPNSGSIINSLEIRTAPSGKWTWKPIQPGDAWPELQTISSENIGDLQTIAELGQGYLHQLFFDETGSKLVTVTHSGIYTYDFESFKQIDSMPVNFLKLNYDKMGLRLLSISSDRNMALYGFWRDTTTKKAEVAIVALPGLAELYSTENLINSEPIMAAAFSPDSKYLAVNSDKGISIIDIASQAEIQNLKSLHTFDLQFSPDGSLLAATLGKSNSIDVWQLSEGKLITTLRGAAPGPMAFSPDNQYLAIANTALQVFRLSDKSKVINVNKIEYDTKSIIYSPDGKYIMLGIDHTNWGGDVFTFLVPDQKNGSKIEQRSAADGSLVREMPSHPNSFDPVDIKFSPDDKLLAINWHDFWEISDQTFKYRLDSKGLKKYPFLEDADGDFSPDSTTIATISYNKFSLWNAETGEKIKTTIQPDKNDRQIKFLPDGLNLLIGGNQLSFWDIQNHYVTDKIPTKLIQAMTLSPDGKFVAIARDLDGQVSAKGAKIYTLDGKLDKEIVTDQKVLKLSYSNSGSLLAMAAENSALYIVSTATGEIKATYPCSVYPYLNGPLAFSPDDSMLACLNKIILLKNGSTIFSFPTEIRGIGWSHNGKLIATGELDEVIRLWAIP